METQHTPRSQQVCSPKGILPSQSGQVLSQGREAMRLDGQRKGAWWKEGELGKWLWVLVSHLLAGGRGPWSRAPNWPGLSRANEEGRGRRHWVLHLPGHLGFPWGVSGTQKISQLFAFSVMAILVYTFFDTCLVISLGWTPKSDVVAGADWAMLCLWNTHWISKTWCPSNSV